MNWDLTGSRGYNLITAALSLTFSKLAAFRRVLKVGVKYFDSQKE
jgi:hypothetical protein